MKLFETMNLFVLRLMLLSVAYPLYIRKSSPTIRCLIIQCQNDMSGRYDLRAKRAKPARGAGGLREMPATRRPPFTIWPLF